MDAFARAKGGEIPRQRLDQHETSLRTARSGDVDADCATAREQLVQGRARVLGGDSLPELLDREVARAIQQERQLVRAARAALGMGSAPARENLGQRARELLVELPRRAEEVLQQRGVEREQRGLSLRARRV